jgi:Flp pilus assembly protein TadD
MGLRHIAGIIAWDRGNDELAERSLEAAFEQEPETPAHGRGLAKFYADHGRMVDALKVTSEARRHRPDDPSLKELEASLLAEFRASDEG